MLGETKSISAAFGARSSSHNYTLNYNLFMWVINKKKEVEKKLDQGVNQDFRRNIKVTILALTASVV